MTPTLVLALAATSILLFFMLPCIGAVVRLRANYDPRGLQIDDEGNIEPHSGLYDITFFGMLRRVKRIEVCLVILIRLPGC